MKFPDKDMETVVIQDKHFRISITADSIAKRIEELAETISHDLLGREVTFLVVLKGAFIFAADLLRKISIPCEVSFIRLSSYEGMKSSEKVHTRIALDEELGDKTVVIVEDIIDSGLTLKNLLENTEVRKAADIRIATLLHKPGNFRGNYRVDYTGFSIPNDFVIGYGLDYKGVGRNLESIYTHIQSS